MCTLWFAHEKYFTDGFNCLNSLLVSNLGISIRLRIYLRLFETGIKVIDLLTPYKKGGKHGKHGVH